MAVESDFTVPDDVSFAESIACTQTLLDNLEQGNLTSATFEATVSALVQSEAGARGFFVTYLSDDRTLADPPAPAVLAALRTSPAIVSPLLVKNLAMSTAMAITHRRHQDDALAKGSERVRSRTVQLIQSLQLPQVVAEAQQLWQAIAAGTGNYQTFLERWGYDLEQRQAIQQTLEVAGMISPTETRLEMP